MNHFARVCQAKNVHGVNFNETPVQEVVEYQHDVDMDCWEIGEVEIDQAEVSHTDDMGMCESEIFVLKKVDNSDNMNIDQIIVKDWYECLNFKNVYHTVKIDSGAQANVISRSSLNSILPNEAIIPSNVKLTAYGGHSLPVIGAVNIVCSPVNDSKCSNNLEFIVIDSNVKTVLGLESSIKLNFINPSPTKIINTFQIDTTSSSKAQVVAGSQSHSSLPFTGRVPGKVKVTNTSYPSDVPDKTLESIIAEYNDVFDNTRVGCIKNCEYDIRLSPDNIPKISKCRPVPFAKKQKIETELKRMVGLGIIEAVDKPTEWVNTYVAVEKGEKTRICLDPSALNKYIQREHIHLPTIDEVYSEIIGGRLYTKLDLKDGYWQIPLSQACSDLTTFHTHTGRYRFKRLPFGLNSANEVFQKRVCQVFGGLQGVKVIYDDILIFGSTEEEHNSRLLKVLQRARKSNVKFNKAKCKFKLSEVTYLGHVISADGIKADPDKVVDIVNMPAPVDKKGIQRLLGTLNFFSRYIPNMSTITHPLRELLGKHTPFHWNSTHNHAIAQIKQVLTHSPVLGYYDVNKPVTLLADASQHGLGAAILQEGQPIAYASRSLTPAQFNYAQIEKELLAIVFGCERFTQYLFGKQVLVHTDHKPLINTINKPLHDNPRRIQRLLLRLQNYDLTLKYVPGRDLHLPDMLSRACSVTNMPSVSECLLTDEADYQIYAVITNLNCSEYMHSRIKRESENDPELEQVKFYVENGWPQYTHDCSELAKPYWSLRAELCFYDGYIIFHDRIVIPQALRAELLDRLHSGHQGRERCKRLARNSVFWPHINRDINERVDKCKQCLEQRNSPPREKLKPHIVPSRAWQKVGIDLFSFGPKRFQIVVDYFSKWIEVDTVPMNANSVDVIKHLNDIFARFGYPEEIFSDGDPLYTSSTFKRFCQVNEIGHTFSSSRYPQSNGQAERGVQHIKNILAKCVNDNADFRKALLMYRNTPLSSDLGSPAELLLNRKLRTNVPCLNLNSDSDLLNKPKLESRQFLMKNCHDKHVRNDVRKDFERDDLVMYKNNLKDRAWNPGKIVKPLTPHRSYQLQNEYGNLINRNRRLIISDKCNKELSYNVDDIPGPTQSTNTLPASCPPMTQLEAQPSNVPLTPAVAKPEIRRSSRTTKKPDFYGNPVTH